MNFLNAIKTCFEKYFDFSARASRSEYWWFVLLWIIVYGLDFINPTLSIVLTVPLIIPMLAVQTRRLHDINKSGWWQLIGFIPIIGIIILWCWSAKNGDSNKNSYGEARIQPLVA
jgi:uncharacterized membrane protein YhaH (DUF805 family)